MVSRLALIVFLCLCGRSVQAGLIPSGDAGEVRSAEPIQLCDLVDWFAAANEELPTSSYLDDYPGDMSSGIANPSLVFGSYCTLIGMIRFSDPPLLAGEIRTSNSILPSSPVLDGLLKPA
jgi:hypothetical protein